MLLKKHHLSFSLFVSTLPFNPINTFLFHHLVLLVLFPHLSLLFLCCFRCSSGSEETREVSQFLYIDPFIFNGPMFPRVGAILCRFRWAGDAVRACCHSVLLRAKAHDLGSALTAIPGEQDVPISPLSNTEDKLKIPDGLQCDGRRSAVVLFQMDGIQLSPVFADFD